MKKREKKKQLQSTSRKSKISRLVACSLQFLQTQAYNEIELYLMLNMRYSSLRFHFPSSFSSTFYCPSSIPLLLFILPSSLPPPSFQYLLSRLSFRPSPSYVLHHSLHSISIPPPPTPPQHSSAPPLLPLPPPFHNDRRVAICCILVIVVDERQTCLEVGAPPS